LAIARQVVLTRNRSIDPSLVDTEGSNVNLYVNAVAVVAQAVTEQLANRASALLLDGAEGEDLTRYGFDRYQLSPKGAAAAVGKVRFFRTTGAGGSGDIAKNTSILSLTGNIEYVTAQTASFDTSTPSRTVECRAVKAGKEFQLGRNQLRRFKAQPFDPAMEVTNDDPTSGGEPAEDEDTYRERIRSFWQAARRGVLAAIEFGAKSVPGVVSALAVETLSQGIPARLVDLFIADSSGLSNDVLARLVQENLVDFRAAGIQVIIGTSLPVIVTIQLRLQFAAGTTDTVAISESVRAAVFDYVNSLTVGETLFRNSLGTLLERFKSSGLLPDQGTVVEPAGDVVPDAGTTLRTTLASITYT